MTNFAEFDKAYGFSEKAGFKLSEMQVNDVHQFLLWDRSLNTYAVGCGKTVVSTVVALMRGKTQKLVLVPPILIDPWGKWLRQVSTGVVEYAGIPKERKAMNVKSAHWLVMSYEIFRRDFARLEVELHGDLEIIVDEAHSLKNQESVLYKYVARLL